jgi:hypothetical protein
VLPEISPVRHVVPKVHHDGIGRRDREGSAPGDNDPAGYPCSSRLAESRCPWVCTAARGGLITTIPTIKLVIQEGQCRRRSLIGLVWPDEPDDGP